MTKLVSLKRTAKEKKEEAKKYSAPAIGGGAADYGYGTCIRLDDHCLDKLGVKEMPKVGAEFTITARACVTEARQSASARNGDDRCLELQITDMALERKGKSLRDDIEEASK